MLSLPRLAAGAGSTSVEVGSLDRGGLAQMEPQGLAVTYWFDAPLNDQPEPFALHVSGRLRGEPSPGQAITFSRLVRVDDLLPRTGRVAVTAQVSDIARGTWDVTATPVRLASRGTREAWEPIPGAASGTASGSTGFAPVPRVRAPGVRLWAWPALVGTGTVVALVLQSLLASRLGLPVSRLLPLSLLACVLGMIGAKTYFFLTHLRQRGGGGVAGMSVQGFVLVAVAVLLGGSSALDLPAGQVLDATAPGMLLGLMVGRVGCLLGGCCAGRPTNSRWGLWSSDRRLGVRRIPVQLLESSIAGAVGVLAFVGVRVLGTSAGGLAFVAALSAYVGGRQLLFPLRSIPRTTAYGRPFMLVVCVIAALGAVAALVLR